MPIIKKKYRKQAGELNHKIDDFNKKACKSQVKLLKNEFVKVNDVNLLIAYLPDFNKALVMNIFDDLKVNNHDYVIILVGKDNAKFPLIVGVSPSLTSKYQANQLLKKVTAILGGSGGGRNEVSQGNVLDVTKFNLITKDILN